MTRPPARTSNLKFSDTKQKIIKQWPNMHGEIHAAGDLWIGVDL